MIPTGQPIELSVELRVQTEAAVTEVLTTVGAAYRDMEWSCREEISLPVIKEQSQRLLRSTSHFRDQEIEVANWGTAGCHS